MVSAGEPNTPLADLADDRGHGFPYGIPFVGSLNDGPGFAGPDAPVESDLYRCVHCGLCLSACPTYVETGLEAESPRGRIALMKAVHEGRAGISDRLVSHWEMCLQCRACEAVCPSGVPYGRIMEQTRSQVAGHGQQSPELSRLSRLFLRAALPHNRRLRMAGHLMRIYQRSGIQALVRKSGLLRWLPGGLADLESTNAGDGKQVFRPPVVRIPRARNTTHDGWSPVRLRHAIDAGRHHAGCG